MKKIILGLIIILYCYKPIFAQPGWAYKVQGNLNGLDSIQIKECLEDENLCYFGPIQIDATTDLSRLDHLNSAADLFLYIDLKFLPNEFLATNWSNIRSLSISSKQLENLSNLPAMNNLEILEVTAFQGDTLKIKNKLPNLKTLNLNYSDKIVSVKNIFINNNLVQLSVRNCKNINLVDSSFYSLKNLYIYSNQPIKFKWEDLVNFKQLEAVILKNINFETIPDHFPKSLRRISILGGKTNLDTLNKLSALKNMEKLYLTDIELIWEK